MGLLRETSSGVSVLMWSCEFLPVAMVLHVLRPMMLMGNAAKDSGLNPLSSWSALVAAIKGKQSPSSTSHSGSLTQDPYEVHGMALPLGVKAHPTRSVAPSKAFARDAPLQDFCDVPGCFLWFMVSVTYYATSLCHHAQPILGCHVNMCFRHQLKQAVEISHSIKP